MTVWWMVLIVAVIGIAGLALIRLAGRRPSGKTAKAKAAAPPDTIQKAVDRQVDHVFSADFREELRNRGRLHFEKIINENALFLQQDLRLTTSQLNEYMKSEITSRLKQDFAKYEQSVADAKQAATESLQKTTAAIEEQRKLLNQQVQQEFKTEKQQLIKRFEDNMTDIVNHYLIQAIGSQIDLDDQLEYILADLEANKAAILEDINNGT